MSDSAPAVELPPDSQVALAIESAAESGQNFVALVGSSRYRVRVDRVQADEPDADRIARSIAAIRTSAGAWKDIDADALKSAVGKQRRSGSRAARRWQTGSY
jgi:hypothetical protein